MRNALVVVGIGAIVLGVGYWFLSRDAVVVDNPEPKTGTAQQEIDPRETQGAAIGEENAVTFSCSEGKSLTAVFERDIVGLTLSDGRQLTLRQDTRAEGIRYISNDSRIEFVGEDSTGTLIENGTIILAECIAVR